MTNSPEMRALDPDALMAAYEAHKAHAADPGRKGSGIEKAIRAYLNALSAPHAPGDVAGLDNPQLPNKVLDDNYARALMADGASGNMSMDTSVAMALIAEVRNARRGSLPHSDGAVAEPVAWRYRAKGSHTWQGVTEVEPTKARWNDLDIYEISPLFASPINPVPAGVGYRYRIKTTECPQWSGWASADSDPHDWLWHDNWTDMQVEETILSQAPDAEQGEGWIEWNSTSDAPPDDLIPMIDVLYRNGSAEVGRADGFSWSQGEDPEDIVAYRRSPTQDRG